MIVICVSVGVTYSELGMLQFVGMCVELMARKNPGSEQIDLL